MTITRDEARQHLLNAADWLEANPDNHIIVDMALDESGCSVPPTDDSATCFCALGRIAKEAGITQEEGRGRRLAHYPLTSVQKWLESYFGSGVYQSLADDIWETNDLEPNDDPRLGRREVIKLLRDIAGRGA